MRVRLCQIAAMPKEIEPSSYQCDCGYVAQFSEDTVKEVKECSRGKKQWLSDGTGIEKHIVVFQDGRFLTMLCPREGRHEKPAPRYTAKQGQYLAFIQQYTTLHGVPPAEHEIQQFFKVSPPTVHQMILMLENKGLIQRTPGAARSIKVLVAAADLPALK